MHTQIVRYKYSIWVFFYVAIFQSSERQSGVRLAWLIVSYVAVQCRSLWCARLSFTLVPRQQKTHSLSRRHTNTLTGHPNIHFMFTWMSVQQVVLHSWCLCVCVCVCVCVCQTDRERERDHPAKNPSFAAPQVHNVGHRDAQSCSNTYLSHIQTHTLMFRKNPKEEAEEKPEQ